jgi:hypothetical protein
VIFFIDRFTNNNYFVSLDLSVLFRNNCLSQIKMWRAWNNIFKCKTLCIIRLGYLLKTKKMKNNLLTTLKLISYNIHKVIL